MTAPRLQVLCSVSLASQLLPEEGRGPAGGDTLNALTFVAGKLVLQRAVKWRKDTDDNLLAAVEIWLPLQELRPGHYRAHVRCVSLITPALCCGPAPDASYPREGSRLVRGACRAGGWWHHLWSSLSTRAVVLRALPSCHSQRAQAPMRHGPGRRGRAGGAQRPRSHRPAGAAAVDAPDRAKAALSGTSPRVPRPATTHI